MCANLAAITIKARAIDRHAAAIGSRYARQLPRGSEKRRKPPQISGDADLAKLREAEQPELLDALGHDPVSLDALLARTGLPTSALQAQLLELELQGVVARLPGGLVQRVAQG